MTSLNSQLFHLPELKVSIIFVEREGDICTVLCQPLGVQMSGCFTQRSKNSLSSSSNRCKQPVSVLAPIPPLLLIHSWILFENKTTLIPCDCHGCTYIFVENIFIEGTFLERD